MCVKQTYIIAYWNSAVIKVKSVDHFYERRTYLTVLQGRLTLA